jgi:hypothetical protein
MSKESEIYRTSTACACVDYWVKNSKAMKKPQHGRYITEGAGIRFAGNIEAEHEKTGDAG